MTDNVRTGYRNHRKAAWGLALLLVAAVATVTIPFASGAPSKTLRFTTQPTSPLESSTSQSESVSVAVFTGGTNPLNSSSTPPSLKAFSATGDDVSAYYSGINAPPSYSGGYWTWNNLDPQSNTPSGNHTFVATLGTLTATSNPFRVVQYICPPTGGDSCDGTSNLSGLALGKLKIANTLNSSVLLDFQAGLNPVPLGCDKTNNPRLQRPDPHLEPPLRRR